MTRYSLILRGTERPRWGLGLVKRHWCGRFDGQPGKTREDAMADRLEILAWPGVESVRIEEEDDDE